MPGWARDLLRCPACHGELAGSGPLTCTVCRRSYPVRDGIPVLLVDEATEHGSA
ncbi:Trm112 family protein [Actinotalea lenta]|uniref:Trm112 family protein n=1 Tax=Actinotalea lenta TaxID=3064654 RepID=UPI002729E3B7|nr:Trm112 family protein [Isoptericola sp. b490]